MSETTNTVSAGAVALDGVTFTYPRSKVPALERIDLRIGEGELVGIIGQNGSGKTTLTKLLNGLLKPTEGTVTVGGVETTDRKVQELARHVGYVFQNPNHQLFSRTVEDELAFGPSNLGIDEDEIKARVDEAVEFFSLNDVLDQHPYRLSFPLRKLVGIASVYTMQPGIIILDEPSTGQDHRTVSTINRVIRRLAEMGSTVLCVSHDMPLLADVVDRVLVMGGGRILADATPSEVFADRDLMSSTNLKAPQATDIGLAVTAPRGAEVALNAAQVAAQVASLVGKDPVRSGTPLDERN